MTLKVFVDFDGTVTTQDVGNVFFRHFGGPICDDFVRDYHSGLISAKECFRRELAAVGTAFPEEVDRFLSQQELRAGFAEFVQFCERTGVEYHILSDGLDLYIGAILARHDLSQVSRFSNTLLMEAPGPDGSVSFAIAFPHDDAECDRCACCKRNIMVGHAGEDDVICYVGDGFSDRCAAQYADVVFAHGELQTFCQEQNISYYHYSSFHDVTCKLQELLSRKFLRKRKRAELRRQDLFMSEP
ncbi:MAG: HAD-IB family phosphatase [Bacteroidota bacterium]